MKYTSLRALIFVSFAVTLTGCNSYDPNYDINRDHDIYRQTYKYKPLPQESTEVLPPAPAVTPDGVLPPAASAPTTVAPASAPAPMTTTPAPAAPGLPAAPPAQ